MKLSLFIQSFVLHDAVIQAIQYQPEQQRGLIDLELCNYLQPTYQLDEVELISGQLIITGITKFLVEPRLELFQKNDLMDAQILEVKLLPNNDNELECWQMGVLVSDYQQNSDQFTLITIQAIDVVWQVTEPMIQLNIPYYIFQRLENRLTLEPFVVTGA